MSRTTIPSRGEAPEATHAILDNVGKVLGFVPNLHRAMSVSPAVLNAFVGIQGPLNKTLDVRTREGIALAVSEVNGCEYCINAHNFILEKFGSADATEVALNRKGTSRDPKRAAAIGFALKVIQSSGKITDEDFAAVRAAGFEEPQVLEIVALSMQFQFTNVINNVVGTPIDFPVADEAYPA